MKVAAETVCILGHAGLVVRCLSLSKLCLALDTVALYGLMPNVMACRTGSSAHEVRMKASAFHLSLPTA